jgi:hypothetical protein
MDGWTEPARFPSDNPRRRLPRHVHSPNET